MLWPSISRWNTQRMRMGKLIASTWCMTMVCRASSTMEPSKMAAMPSRLPRCTCQNSAIGVVDSQSTTRLITPNRKAS